MSIRIVYAVRWVDCWESQLCMPLYETKELAERAADVLRAKQEKDICETWEDESEREDARKHKRARVDEILVSSEFTEPIQLMTQGQRDALIKKALT